MQSFLDVAERCAERIKRSSEVLVVSHIDADGLTSASIICKALERCGIDYSVRFVKQLEERVLEELKDENPETIVFTDLGSGMASEISSGFEEPVILDHHQVKGEAFRYHLNPHLFGFNGSTDISGAGVAYFVATCMSENYDLSALAVVGALGDLQHVKEGRLRALNRIIVDEGVEKGFLEVKRDILLFGKQTRPVFKMLEFSSDPFIPGITGSERGAIEFLTSLGIPLKDDRWRRWIDLREEEKRKIVSALIERLISFGESPKAIERLFGEVYILLREEEGTELRDAMEFSTLLNATARYDEAEIGLRVCMGDRGDALRRARTLLNEHRRNLVNGLKFVIEGGIQEMENLRYFHAGEAIRDTIVGIVAGMTLNSHVKGDKPIVAFAESEEGIKVSARGTMELVSRGLNLGEAMKIASQAVGGTGGGHDIAAGALIPRGREKEFLENLNRIIGRQMKDE
ncbi:MAG: single-stranded-DNA-specific exonuclease [Archaeoglobi archaeon]|nr:single-stranded-DNA-specific exonuclease [Archaeoglobi archaeon]